jgi:hypothetical protein
MTYVLVGTPADIRTFSERCLLACSSLADALLPHASDGRRAAPKLAAPASPICATAPTLEIAPR